MKSRPGDRIARWHATRHRELLVAGKTGWDVRGSTVSASLGYGDSSFVFDYPADVAPVLFDVRYRSLRAGAGLERPLGQRVRIGARAGWRYLLSTGEMDDEMWFPRLSGGVIDGEIGASYEVLPRTRVNFGIELCRYYFAMNPQMGDARIAGGAVDQYVSASLGVSQEWGWP